MKPLPIILLISFLFIPAINAITKDSQPAKVMTRGLNHLGLSVSNLELSTNFFVNTLGWKLAGGYPDYPSKFVTDGLIFLTLWQIEEPSSAIAFNRKKNVGLHHLALTVANRQDLDILHQRFLKTKGVTIEFAPELNGQGPTVHMMIREPSGNRIELAFNPK